MSLRLHLVQVDELHQVGVALLGSLLVPGEQDLGPLGELAGQAGVAGLVQKDSSGPPFFGKTPFAAGAGCAPLKFPLSNGGKQAEQVPVAAVHGLLHLLLAVHHAALDGVHLAGGVADDEGRAMIGLGLGNGLQGLGGVGAQSRV